MGINQIQLSIKMQKYHLETFSKYFPIHIYSKQDNPRKTNRLVEVFNQLKVPSRKAPMIYTNNNGQSHKNTSPKKIKVAEISFILSPSLYSKRITIV